MFSWYTALNAQQRKTFWGCYAGWSLDAMDVQLYSFLIPTLSLAWSMSNADAGVLASSALLTSALGGWVTGILADRYGRVRMLQITILWYSVFTAASGLTNSFGELLVIRSLQGFGFGGEWTAGAVLIGEVVQDRHRGRTVGTLQGGWAVGWALAALLSTFGLTSLPAEWGWRVAFFVGAAPAAMLIFIRRHMREPDLFIETAASRKATGIFKHAGRIFQPSLLLTTVLASLVSTGALGGYYAMMTWLPTYLRLERGLTVLSSGGYLAVIITGAFLGYLAGAHLTDAIGRRRTFLAFALGCFTIAACYTHLPIGNGAMLVLGFPLGFCSAGVLSGIGPLMTELYPTSVRAAGQGFSYSFGRAVAAFFPTLVGVLSASVPLGTAIAWFAGGAYGVLIAAVYCLPETRGRSLSRE